MNSIYDVQRWCLCVFFDNSAVTETLNGKCKFGNIFKICHKYLTSSSSASVIGCFYGIWSWRSRRSPRWTSINMWVSFLLGTNTKLTKSIQCYNPWTIMRICYVEWQHKTSSFKKTQKMEKKKPTSCNTQCMSCNAWEYMHHSKAVKGAMYQWKLILSFVIWRGNLPKNV